MPEQQGEQVDPEQRAGFGRLTAAPQPQLRVCKGKGKRLGPRLEKEVDDGVAPALVVEEDEERPVREPRAVREQRQRVRLRLHLLVNHILDPVEVLQRLVPVLHQDVRRELAPESAERPLAVVAQRAVVAEELGGAGVVAAVVLEPGVEVERLDVLVADLVLFGEHLEVRSLVGAELLDERGVGQEGDDLRR